MNPIMCPCGLEKDVVYGVAICGQHCDEAVCKGADHGCPLCARYLAITDYRARIEYAREKNHG